MGRSRRKLWERQWHAAEGTLEETGDRSSWRGHVALWIVLAAVFAALETAEATPAVRDVLWLPVPLHIVLEVIAVSISLMIFGVAWHSRVERGTPDFAPVGLAFLAVGLMDMLHMLSFPGMPHFVTPSGVEKGIHFWFVGRNVAAITVLAMGLGWHPKLPTALSRRVALVAVLAACALVSIPILNGFEGLPVYWTPEGLTPLKVAMEYLLVATFLAAGWSFLWRGIHRRREASVWIASACIVSALSELCFTHYQKTTDAFQLLGHLNKAIAYAMLYRAVFVVLVKRPYERIRAEVEARSAAEALATDREQMLRAFIDSAPYGFIVATPDGRVSVWNRGAELIFGVSAAEMIGRTLDRFVPPETLPAHRQAIERFCAVERGHRPMSGRAITALRGDGSPFPADIAIACFEADGQMMVSAIVRDLTVESKLHQRLIRTQEELERTIERLDHANRTLEERVRQRTHELQSANRDLESFSYSVSHDLRAPLRAMGGYASLLAEDESDHVTDEGRKMLAAIQRNADQMSAMVDSLLDLSRIGRQALDCVDVDVRALAHTIADAWKAEYPKTRFTCSAVPSAWADARMLRHVLDNLIGNAFKYSSKVENPEVAMGWDEAQGAWFVRDNGDGFDADYTERLFKPFQRLHTAREFPGNGIGLATVKRVVERHGGHVWAHARRGEGATFYFTLGERPA